MKYRHASASLRQGFTHYAERRRTRVFHPRILQKTQKKERRDSLVTPLFLLGTADATAGLGDILLVLIRSGALLRILGPAANRIFFAQPTAQIYKAAARAAKGKIGRAELDVDFLAGRTLQLHTAI